MQTTGMRFVLTNPALDVPLGRAALSGPAGTEKVPTAVSASPTPERAGLLTKAGRLRHELTTWAKAGMPLVPRAVRQERLQRGCQLCPYYNAVGNLGMGECKHPGCGCTRVKLALATSRCPAQPPKWAAWAAARPVQGV